MSQQAKILYLINYVGILACILVSGPLWGFGGRDIPEIPFFTSIEIGLGAWALFFSCLGICSLGLTLIFRERLTFLLGLVAFVILILSDVTRLQPWLYIHLFIMGYLVFTEVISAKRAIILILGLTYAWSGLQKFNVFFAVEFYPWLWQAVDQDFMKLSYEQLILAQSEGIVPQAVWTYKIAALFEFSSGIILIVFYKKWWAFLAPCLMHLILFELLGPWSSENKFNIVLWHSIALAVGCLIYFRTKKSLPALIFVALHLLLSIFIIEKSLNFNMVIWPWNLMLILLLVFVSKTDTEWENKSFLKPKFYPIYLLVGIAPLLFPFFMWDSHLSGSLYSGQNSSARFYFDAKEGCACITNSESGMSEKVSVFDTETQEGIVYLDNWVIIDVEAPFYPEERYFKAFAKKLCDCQSNNSKSRLEIDSKVRWGVKINLENEITKKVEKTGKSPLIRRQVFKCSDLK